MSMQFMAMCKSVKLTKLLLTGSDVDTSFGDCSRWSAAQYLFFFSIYSSCPSNNRWLTKLAGLVSTSKKDAGGAVDRRRRRKTSEGPVRMWPHARATKQAN